MGKRLGSMDDGGPVAILRGLKGLKGLRGLRGPSGLGWGVGTRRNDECAEAFVRGADDCKGYGSLSVRNGVVYSYSAKIAWREPGVGIVLDCERHSVTTSKHQGYVFRALENAGRSFVCKNELQASGTGWSKELVREAKRRLREGQQRGRFQ